MDLVVDPAYQRRGLGGALLDFLIVQARLAGATSLQARAYAEQRGALALLDRRGFRETMRMTGLELSDVSATRAGNLDELRHALDGQGMRIATLSEALTTDAHAWEKLHAANQAARFGWPEPDPLPGGEVPPPETPEQFRARSEHVRLIPEACFLAMYGSDFVGYSALTAVDASATEAGSGGTAVHPDYRGRGIATALKACCVAWAREHGVGKLTTSSGNPAMVHVNEKFGFRRTYAEVRLVRRFWEEALAGADGAVDR